MIDTKKKTSLRELRVQFRTIEGCVAYICDLNNPLNWTCKKCNKQTFKFIKTRPTIIYCTNCKTQISILKNTIFENSKITLVEWFSVISYMIGDKRGVSALHLERLFSINRSSTMIMLRQLREIMGIIESKLILNGVIEMDEFFIGGPGGRAGRGTSKEKVLIAVSSGHNINVNVDPNGLNDEDLESVYIYGKLFVKMQVVPNLAGNTIINFIENNISKDSEIVTDAYLGYRTLSKKGYSHKIETNDYSDSRYKYLHILISNFKSFIQGTYHGSTDQHLQLFINEFCYRFNRRNSFNDLFESIIKIALVTSKKNLTI